jgi:dipeptidyl aminopeptidase/acylaminoacyl peptidase
MLRSGFGGAIHRIVLPVSRPGTILIGLALLLGTAAQAAAPPTIAQFAADVDASMPALSPDGTKVAYVTRAQGARALVVADLVKGDVRILMEAVVAPFELTRCRFKGNERLVCGFRGTVFLRGQPYPVSRLVSVDVAGNTKPKVLFEKGEDGKAQYQDRVLDWQRNDPRHVLIAISGDGDPFPRVLSLDVVKGTSSLVLRARSPIMSWRADREGVVRFGYGFDGTKYSYVARDSATAPWRTLARWETGKSDFSVVDFGPTPGTLLVEALHHGRGAIFEMDLNEKSDRQLLFAHPEVDVGEPIYWPADGRIIGFAYETERSHRMLFDEVAKVMYDAIDKLLPGADNVVVDASLDGQKLLVISRADVRPTEYYVLDLDQKKLEIIASANPALAQTPHAPMHPVKIKASDGQVLPGYLTLPLGSSGKDLPTVVFPHGGPYARDSWRFDSMVQFMASRGYAVVQVNFRGSTGYGDDWYKAGLRNWGTVMIDDVTAATRWAVAEGIADPARTCIVGWSYGGYAALMSAVRQSDLYRCVVSIAGIADLRALVNEERRFYGGELQAEFEIGDDNAELKAGSPTRSADKIKVPVLLIHGDNDWQAHIDHSRRMARALARENKKHELVVIPDGNHSLSRYEWRETLLTKLEAFLAANN